uniref:Dynactin subunit 5 n=1 Tax=Acrobeloides nanus TaxID=290746 RepID=A0A914C9Q4_9BILA
MELPLRHVEAEETIETSLGNKISRKCAIYGSQNIVLNGNCILMRDGIIRGDLASIRTGKYCVIGERTVIRPSYKYFSKGLTYFPMHIGDHVYIDEDCVVMAAQVGAFVHIGKDSIIGRSCVIKDCVQILPGSVLAPDTVVPPFTIMAGNPAKMVGELPESTVQLMAQATKSFYENYVARPKAVNK